MTFVPNDPEARLQLMRDNMEMLTKMVPWARHLGFQVTRLERGKVWATQPFAEDLVGAPGSGILHGGVVTTFLDNLCGMSCSTALDEMRFVATLDLRIDYMRPSEPFCEIKAEAECYHFTRTVAFCRAWAYHEDREHVIATAQGAFAINQPRPAGAAMI